MRLVRAVGLSATVALAVLAPLAPVQAADPVEDLIAPKITTTRPAGHVDGWYAAAPTVFAKATDDHPFSSGVRFVSYELTGATVGQGTLDRLAGGNIPISENSGQTQIRVEATDGNDNTAEDYTMIGVDRVAPTATPTGRLQNGAVFAQGESVLATYSCADAHSGIGSCTGTVNPGAPVDTSTIGDKIFVMVAVDRVGRSFSTSVSYKVVSADFGVVKWPGVPSVVTMGQEVVATAAEFSPQPAAIDYQWRRNGVPISGATGLRYRTTPDDVGQSIRLAATATRPGWNSRTELSIGVTVNPAQIVLASGPTLSGPARYSAPLTIEHGAVTPATATIAYEWFRDGVLIPGASGKSYWADVDDIGHRISGRVDVRATGYASKAWVTEPSEPVRGLDLEVSGSTGIQGSMRVGSVLTAVPATIREPLPSLAPGESAALSYRWLRDGRPIAGATASTYRVQAADAGHRLAVAVTGTAVGYEPATSTSPAGGVVQKAVPVVRGRLQALGGGKARLTVTVSVPGIAPTGKVTVKRGRTVVAKNVVLRGGRAVITLRKQPKGRVAYVVQYGGAPGIAPTKVTIRGRIR